MKENLNCILQNIPEGESSDNLKNIFKMFLDENFLLNHNRISLLEFLEELSDKQWHSYNLLDPDLFSELEHWLGNNYSINDSNEVELVLNICVRLGFNNLYLKIISNNEYYNPKTKIIIQEIIDECGYDISDPFESLR